MRFLYARTAEGGKQMNQTALKSLVKQICESTSSSQYVRLRYLDELYTEIEAVSGLSVERILKLLLAGYTLRKEPKWFSVDELLPEDCAQCYFYTDAGLNFTTVLVMDKDGLMELKNRLRIDKIGISYVDKYVTSGWEWSASGVKPAYWCPIPKKGETLLSKL